MRCDLGLEEVGRRVPEAECGVPPTELDPTELRVVVGVPLDESLAAELLVAPGEELEVVVEGVVEPPVDELHVLDPRGALRAPELGRPRVDAEVVVGPVVRDARDDLLRVVLEVVVHAHRGIPRELCRLLADDLEHAQVERRQVVVGVGAVRPQVHAGVRVVLDERAHVRPVDQALHDGADLRLRCGIRAGAVLLAFGAPLDRVVAVHVEPGERGRRLDGDSVEVLDLPLGEEPVVRAGAAFDGVSRHEQAVVGRRRLPRAVRVFDPHHEDAPVAVHVLRDEPVLLIGQRVRTSR
jgi:hypothetical protein